ncbi:MAG: hypothetical protein LUP94_00870 [Candidatus Methanomethylicus sp.]|nr:hypothetical protein [Candidatus Methanomethylicus sp.]
MPFEFKVKLNKMKYSLWFVVPKQVTDYLDLEAGDTLAIAVSDHAMTVRKVSATTGAVKEVQKESVEEVLEEPEINMAPKASDNRQLKTNKIFRSKFK